MKSIFFKKISFRYLAAISFLALLGIFYYILHNSYQGDIKNHKKTSIDELSISYNAIINLHHRTSLMLYETVINTQTTWEIMQQANSSDSTDRDQARTLLYNHLKDQYTYLTDFNIRQLHFHLPNNHSFLRFHRPDKYGDDLSKVRYSISETNRLKSPHMGFEEGRIYNGFRYVFPVITKNKTHLGSVEVSIDFKAIKKELNKLHPKTYAFYIKKDLVEKKVFNSEKSNYCSTTLNENYLRENCDSNDSITETTNAIINAKIKDKIGTFEHFSIIHRQKHNFSLITFIPIKNVQNQHSAYIVSYEKDDTIKYIIIKYVAIILFSIILLAFLADLLIQLRKSNIQLENNEKLLIKSNQTKDKFFSIIAHDIKGPVSSSVELIRLLNSHYNTLGEARIKQTLDVIFNSLDDTYKLLLNLLSWSRTQRGTIEFKPKNINLLPLVTESISPLEQLAKNKDISLNIDIAEDINVYADQDMLSTITRNLVSNAIKFTPHKGSIYINAKVKDENRFVTISIKDNGLGIPQKNQEHLLDIDSETSTKGTDNESGTGLGLVLCKEFTNYHKGEIWFESNENTGTTFYFTMPTR